MTELLRGEIQLIEQATTLGRETGSRLDVPTEETKGRRREIDPYKGVGRAGPESERNESTRISRGPRRTEGPRT